MPEAGPAFSLENRVAVITGAAGDIGLAIALRYARAGARLALLDLDPAALAEGVEATGMTSSEFLLLSCDVSSEDEVKTAIAATSQRFGRIDILVNNAAALTPLAPTAQVETAAWRQVIEVNLTGAFLMARECLRPMIAAQRGVIINVASQLAHVTTPGRAAYSASKAALLSLTRSIALDHAGDDIRAVSLSPGAIMTSRLTRLIGSPDEVSATLVGDYPSGRIGTADEVAAAALFLASDDAAFVTGSDILIDGGYTAR